MKAKAATKTDDQVGSGSDGLGTRVTITAPNFQHATFRLIGTTPLVYGRFSEKDKNTMQEAQQAGGTAKSKKTRDPKNFEARYLAARHVASPEGWVGINATGFRHALVGACRLVGYKMTLAKLSVFVEQDGWGDDGTPLVNIIKGKPSMFISPTRNANGSMDLRARPKWEPGWEVNLRLRWDADQFTAQDVTNLLMRVGSQCGIGAGRPNSTNSCGMGWGLFRIAASADDRKFKAVP